MTELRLGIIGLSSGNGHPYSWSAIFNGYDPAEMAKCPFPAIPRYLAGQSFPGDAIPHAKVTHVWTQDPSISSHIAAAARIPNVAGQIDDMIGSVDAVLLARDDAENHEKFAVPFLKAGLPIYIDKPLALSIDAAQRLYALQRRPGQIFTCSALRYAHELHVSAADRAEIGEIVYVDACAPKDWDKYSVHVIEPLLAIVGWDATAVGTHSGKTRHLDLRWPTGTTGRVSTTGTENSPFALRIFGTNCWRKLEVSDTFFAFRSALAAFTDIVRGAAPPQDPSEPLAVVRMIESGRNSS